MSATRFILLLAVALTAACTEQHAPAAPPVATGCDNHGGSPLITAMRVDGVFVAQYHCPDGTVMPAPASPNGLRKGEAS